MQGRLDIHTRKWVKTAPQKWPGGQVTGYWQVRCESVKRWFEPPRPYGSFTCPHCNQVLTISSTVPWHLRG